LNPRSRASGAKVQNKKLFTNSQLLPSAKGPLSTTKRLEQLQRSGMIESLGCVGEESLMSQSLRSSTRVAAGDKAGEETRTGREEGEKDVSF
jgi:hypothetical protein